MKKVLLVLVIAITSITLVGCAKEREFNPENGYITIGLEADYPPFNWYETKATDFTHKLEGGGYVAGYDVEIAKLIAKGLDLELRIVQMDWNALIPSLQGNKIDLIIAGMSATEERKEAISFTESYYESSHVVVVKKGGNYTDLENLDGLNGARGQGQIGTIYADLVDYVTTNHGSTSLPVGNTVSIIATAIISNAADFTVVELPVALGLVSAHPNDLQIELNNGLNNFNVSDEDKEVAIGLRKVDSELQKKINEILKGITLEQRTAIMEQAVKNQSLTTGA